MKKPIIFKTLLVFSLFLLSSGLCFAQTEEEKAEAKKFFKEGVSYFESGKHAQALEAFQKSYKFRPLWAIRFNLGLCFKELGMYTRAKHEFHLFLKEGGSEVKSSMKKQIEQELAQLAGTIGIMEIEIDVKGAQVSMDGKSIGKSPLERKVEIDPGSHILSISKKGYEPLDEEFILSKGERKSFKLALTPIEGEVKVIPEDKGKKKKKKKEKEKAGKKKKSKIKPGWAFPTFVATLVLAVAGAGVGSAMLGLASGKSGELEDIDKDCEDHLCADNSNLYAAYLSDRSDITDTGKLYLNLMYAFYAVAGAAVVGVIVSLVVGKPFSKTKVEKEKSAKEKLLNQMNVAISPANKELYLLLLINFLPHSVCRLWPVGRPFRAAAAGHKAPPCS